MLKNQFASGAAWVLSACWRGNGPPRLRRVGGVRARPPTMKLRYGSYTYGWLQSRIFDNGRKPDRATPRAGRRASACKLLLSRKKGSWFFGFHWLRCVNGED